MAIGLIGSMDINPYEAPAEPYEVPIAIAPDDVWLVTASVVLAVLCEVFPLEADLLIVFVLTADIAGFLSAKSGFLTIILIPICIYGWRHGYRGLKRVKGRATAVAVIVGINLIFNTMTLLSLFFRSPFTGK